MCGKLPYIPILYFLDILGVVLFVGDTRTVNGAYDQKNIVAEIIITDHRYCLIICNFYRRFEKNKTF